MKIAYLGDGNNVCNSWLKAAIRIPMDLRIGTTKNTMPDQSIVDEVLAAGKSTVTLTEDPNEAVKDADVIYTDVWASMGQKDQLDSQVALLKDFQVNSALVSKADPKCIVMHCLPAERGREITDEVIDSEQSVVFDQAENRLHAQKAIMVKLSQSV